MECYNILGINKTKDKNIIHQAYLELLPLYSTETDPEGFNMLRNAYTEAMAIAEKLITDEESKKQLKDFMILFEENYNDFQKRIDIETWRNLFTNDICLDYELSEQVNKSVLTFIFNNFYFPQEVWSFFDSFFSWSKKTEELSIEFPKDFIEFIIMETTAKKTLQYSLLLNSEVEKYDDFIKEYYNASKALDTNNLYQVKTSLDIASQICPEHPDLLILTARYYIKINQVDNADMVLTKIIENNNIAEDAYYYRGENYFKMGQLEQAYYDYKEALNINPNLLGIIFAIGKCCLCLNRFDQAIIHLKKANEITPNNKELQYLLSSAYYFRIDELEKSIQEIEANTIFLYQLAEAYYETNQIKKSYELINKLEQMSPLNIDTLLLKIKISYDLHEYESCYTAINLAIEKYPENAMLYYYKALILQKYDKHKIAVNTFIKAINLKNNNVLFYKSIVLSLFQIQDFNETIEFCNLGLNYDDNDLDLHKFKADSLFNLNKYSECLEVCNKCLEINNTDEDLFVLKMKIYNKLNVYNNTLEVFNKAIKMNINSPMLYNLKGIALLENSYNDNLSKKIINDNCNTAIKCFDKALEMDCNLEQAYLYRAKTYFFLHQYSQALDAINTYIKLDSNFHEAYIIKIKSLIKQNNYNEALDTVMFSINNKFNNLDEFYELASEIYIKINSIDDAINFLNQAIMLKPTPSRYYNLATLLVGDKTNISIERINKAIGIVNKSLEMDPLNFNAIILMSKLLFDIQEYEQALKFTKKAFEMNPNNIESLSINALCLFALNDIDNSFEFCNKCLNIDSNNLSILQLKISILRKKKKYKYALKALFRLEDTFPNTKDTLTLKIIISLSIINPLNFILFCINMIKKGENDDVELLENDDL